MARSFMAWFAATYFRMKHKPTEAQAEAELDQLMRRGEEDRQAPRALNAICVNRVFYVNKDSASDRIVFYLHGGGYQHDFSSFHWKFMQRIVQQTNAVVIAPAYHLIPFGSCRDAFDLIVPLYRKACVDYPDKKIVMMGDSSGGGLALSLTEYFKAEGIRMPDEVILMSPWVDVSMENPDISEYIDKDPWLTVPWLKVCGRHWAGAYDLHDYRVSPIFGDVSGLRNVTLFLGTRELFYPDVMKLYDMLDKQGNRLIIGDDMIHVFPILPIPEAKGYCEMIYQTIKR